MFGEEVAEGVHHIRCPFMRPGYFTGACAILGKNITLVDSGTPASPDEAIFPYLSHMGRRPRETSMVVHTHAHFDHCGGTSVIKRASNAKAAVHVRDKPLMEDAPSLNRQLNRRFPEICPPGLFPEFESVKADLALEDGDRLTLEERVFRIIHVPGHSEGSIVLLEEETGLCISGDSIQGRGERRPLLFFSAPDYIDSVRKLTKESIDTLILGHPFPPFNKGVLHGEETRTFLSASLKAIEELSEKVRGIVEASSEPLPLNEICKRIPEARPVTVGCIVESLSS